MKVLISSNSIHTKTGYGTQSKGLANALKAMGHQVAVFAWYGLQGGMIRAGGIDIYPRLRHPYGDDAAIIARDFDADLLITLQDVWVLSENFAESLPCPWAPWFPIDGEPLPPPIQERVEKADYPIVYSEYGARQMEEAGLQYTYIPHAIDTETFSPGDKQAVREKIGVPDGAYLVSMVAANKGYPSRKSLPEVIQAFKIFHERHPEAYLYLHMAVHPKGEGLDMQDVIRLVGLPEDSFRFADQSDYALGLPDSYLADIYRASDMLLSPSQGEGFGLPIAEAQACGCPVLVQDVTSMSELCINGIAIEPLQRTYTPIGHWQYTASVEAIADGLERWYGESKEWKEEKAAKGIAHFREHYSWDVAAKRYWKPFLQMVEYSQAARPSEDGQEERARAEAVTA